MKIESLTAYPRTGRGSKKAKNLRAEGRLPGVVYGPKAPTQQVEISAREMEKMIHHSASEILLVDLNIEKDERPKRLSLVKEIQHHPLSGEVLHVDFLEVAEDKEVTVRVPVEAVGEAVGVKTSDGLLEHVLNTITVRGLPKDVPEIINVDVSDLDVNQTIHIGDISLPEGVEVVGEKHIPVFSVAAPRGGGGGAGSAEAAGGKAGGKKK